MKNLLKGGIVTFIGGLLVLFIFYGDILRNPNEYYFSADGDGLKAYAGAVYHVKHDTNMYRMDAMNYPYGEMVNFTGSQPLITNAIKRIDKLTGIDFSDSVVGIMNLFMLFTIVLGAVFLYLVFYELKCKWWYASLVALGIVMLSPQIDRMGGHFSLSYIIWFPLMIWLFMKYDQKRNIWLAILLGFTVYLSAGMHLYFLGFWGFFIGIYWLYRFVSEQKAYKNIHHWLHFFIQLILPFLILQLIIKYHDQVIDRTTHPWGFFTFRSRIAAILLPLREPYTQFLQSIDGYPNYEWETYAFIGMVALIGFIIGIYQLVKRIITRKSFLEVTDRKILNILFWASIIALLFSFALPFSLDMRWLLEYLTPIRQLRGLARFSWLFFYMLNIIVFYGIHQYYIKNRRKGIILILIAVSFLFYDGYANVTDTNKNIQNKINRLSDKENISDENQWVHNINFEDYQAMLPLPYFHIGSESIWLDPPCGIITQSFIISMKTGLPSMGTMLSRTSLSQTYKSVQLVTQPYNPYKILADFPNQKPLLVVAATNCSELKESEKKIIKKSQFLFKLDAFSYYKLTLDSLRTLPIAGKAAYQKEFFNIVQQSKIANSGYVYEDFDDLTSEETQKGRGAFQRNFRDNKVIFEANLLGGIKNNNYIVRFWVKDYQKDLYARSVVVIQQKNENGDVIRSVSEQIFRNFIRMDKDWVQVEVPITLAKNNPKIVIMLKNKYLNNTSFNIDELTIHPNGINNTENEIEKIKKRILSDEKWLNNVKQKALKRHISLDSMLTLDAIWMIENE